MQNIYTPLTIAITGTNRGLGFELAKNLCSRENNFKLLLTSRDKTKGELSCQNLKKLYPKAQIQYFQVDIANNYSQDNFVKYLQKEKIALDVLVNNAGVFKRTDFSYGSSLETININFKETINFTEKMLPFIMKNGKIIQVSSQLGKLNLQGEIIQQKLQDPKLNKQILFNYADEFLQQIKNQKIIGWSPDSYNVSKCLLNTYVRYCAKNILKEDQQMFSIHPGWCRTDMGTQEATLAPEEGIISVLKCIFDIPFKKTDDNYQYFDEKGIQYKYW